jgi:hypothetical protein
MLVKEGLDPKEWMVRDEDRIAISFVKKDGSPGVKVILK